MTVETIHRVHCDYAGCDVTIDFDAPEWRTDKSDAVVGARRFRWASKRTTADRYDYCPLHPSPSAASPLGGDERTPLSSRQGVGSQSPASVHAVATGSAPSARTAAAEVEPSRDDDEPIYGSAF